MKIHREEQSMILNYILWKMLESLEEVTPEQEEFFGDPYSIVDRFFARFENKLNMKKLSDDQLRKVHHEDQFGLFCDYEEFEQIARAVEQLHNIHHDYR